ncbi:MAG: hypothetical protein U0Q21_14510 [Dermatophilaceae bacterium]
MTRRGWRLAMGALIAIAWTAPITSYADDCQEVSCTDDGKSFLLARDVLDLDGGHVNGTPQQFFDYGTAPYCGGDIPEEPGGVDCHLMNVYCDDFPGNGPAVWVFQRRINPDTPWERQGYTCYPNLIPGKVDLLAIGAAFHRTTLATPGLHIQPEGNLTLVTLPTYFEVEWPSAGFQPGEDDILDPRDWFGMTITIRPQLDSLTYDFGDGTSQGPTTSTGGPYPTGDIVHTYADPGTYSVRADAVYRGYVSIDDSEWIEIPGEVAIPGTPENLRVATARNHLYLPGG